MSQQKGSNTKDIIIGIYTLGVIAVTWTLHGETPPGAIEPYGWGMSLFCGIFWPYSVFKLFF